MATNRLTGRTVGAVIVILISFSLLSHHVSFLRPSLLQISPTPLKDQLPERPGSGLSLGHLVPAFNIKTDDDIESINANFHPRSTPVNSTSAHRQVKRVESLSYADAVCKGRLLWANVQNAFNGQRAPGRDFGQAEFDEAWSIMPTEGRPSPVGQHWDAALRDFVRNPPLGIDVVGPESRSRKFPTQSKRFFNDAGRPVDTPTEGHYDITFVPVCATMIATTALSPSASIADDQGSPYGHPVDARDVPNLVPPMHRFSDLAWFFWTKATVFRGRLRYIGHDFILSEVSVSIMDHLAMMRFGNADVNLPWPGLSYGIETDEAKALLAVPNGIGVAYIMMDRAGGLGRRQPTVHIFKNDRGKWCMLWDLAPV